MIQSYNYPGMGKFRKGPQGPFLLIKIIYRANLHK